MASRKAADSAFYVLITGQVESAEFSGVDNLYCRYAFSYGVDWVPAHGVDNCLSQIARRNSGGADPSVVWNIPVDIAFRATNAYGWPRIAIVVFGIDALGRDNAARVKAVAALKEGGIFVSANVDFPFDEAMQAALAAKKATGELSSNQPQQEWLQEIAQLIDAGQVKVVISQVYPLAQVADAHRESQTWHVQGKLVLQILPNNEPV